MNSLTLASSHVLPTRFSPISPDFLGRLRPSTTTTCHRRESTFHLYEVKVESRFSRKPSGGPREPRGGPENLGRRRVPEVRDTDDDDYYYVAGNTTTP